MSGVVFMLCVLVSWYWNVGKLFIGLRCLVLRVVKLQGVVSGVKQFLVVLGMNEVYFICLIEVIIFDCILKLYFDLWFCVYYVRVVDLYRF